MDGRRYRVLFICTGNSSRSILGEALLNSMAPGRFQGFSAGSQPKGQVHPLALQELQRLQLPTEGLRSKSWQEFAAPGAPPMDFVFTVCDQAAGEVCPVWPGQPVTAHWGLPDPAAVQGPDDVRRRAFRDTAMHLKRRLDLLLALPIARLERLAIQTELRQIGNSP